MSQIPLIAFLPLLIFLALILLLWWMRARDLQRRRRRIPINRNANQIDVDVGLNGGGVGGVDGNIQVRRRLVEDNDNDNDNDNGEAEQVSGSSRKLGKKKMLSLKRKEERKAYNDWQIRQNEDRQEREDLRDETEVKLRMRRNRQEDAGEKKRLEERKKRILEVAKRREDERVIRPYEVSEELRMAAVEHIWKQKLVCLDDNSLSETLHLPPTLDTVEFVQYLQTNHNLPGVIYEHSTTHLYYFVLITDNLVQSLGEWIFEHGRVDIPQARVKVRDLLVLDQSPK